MIGSDLPREIRARLAAEIRNGEQVVWSGQPRARRRLAGFGIWLFAVPWTAFALFWETAALSPWFRGGGSGAMEKGFSIVFPLFGVPFVVIGLGMMAAPFYQIARARRTLLALTSQRLLRITWGRSCTVRSVLLHQVGPVTRVQRRDGSGDLKVETHSRVDHEGDRITDTFTMEGVPDVAWLERELLTRVQQAGSAVKAP